MLEKKLVMPSVHRFRSQRVVGFGCRSQEDRINAFVESIHRPVVALPGIARIASPWLSASAEPEKARRQIKASAEGRERWAWNLHMRSYVKSVTIIPCPA